MHVHQIILRDAIDTGTVRGCGNEMLGRLGPMLACAWPEMTTWLNDIVPELAGEQPQQPFADYQLTPRETRRLLSREFDTIYPVNNEVLLTRLLLAAIRHSELSIVLVPQHVSRGHLVGLLRLAGESGFAPSDPHQSLRANWLLNVGCYDVDDRIVRLLTDRREDLEELTALLAPLGPAEAPQLENRTP